MLLLLNRYGTRTDFIGMRKKRTDFYEIKYEQSRCCIENKHLCEKFRFHGNSQWHNFQNAVSDCIHYSSYTIILVSLFIDKLFYLL